MKQLFKYISKYKLDLIISIFLVAVSAIASLVIPKLLEYVINDGIQAKGGPDHDLIQQLGITMLVVAIISLVCGVANSFFAAKLSQNVGADMRDTGFKKVQDFSYQDIEKLKSANLVVRLTNDVNQIQKVIMLSFSTLLRAPILLIGGIIFAMTTIPDLWYVILILLVLVILVLVFVAGSMFPLFGRFQGLIDKINETIKENFVGARVVKSFVQEQNEEKKFDGYNSDLAKLNLKIGRNFAIVMPALMIIVNGLVVLAIYLAGDLAIGKPEIIGAVFAYINYLSTIMMALIVGGMVLIQVSRSLVSLKRYNEILETTSTFSYPQTGITHIDGNVEFKDVYFTYPDHDTPSLIDINFKVNAGEKIGIIGATGSGKSTLVQVMLRLFDVTKGEVLIDNHNIKEIPKQVLRDNMAIVLQRPVLFSGTIKDNLAAGVDVEDHLIQEAATFAQASEFIDRLDNGYDAIVQQRGSNFSGGQKQRLSIARGLLKKAPILVLDDSTSALDSLSEKRVKEAIYNKSDGQTVFIIAQKISSIIDADKIIVMDDGHLVGFDSHRNLIKDNPVYQEIYDTQKGRGQNVTTTVEAV